MIGKTVSHYTLLKKLGEGGMGEVYLAHDAALDRRVALKLLPQQATRNKESGERFRREAQAAAQLNHPNIIVIYEIFEEQGQTYISMEYVEGHSLREEISRGPLRIDRVMEIAGQLADGLDAAHQAGIVHRDIKPENILIDSNDRVRILDFGLAKLKTADRLTREHSTLGTVHYLSPEQARGEDVDQRADLWSLGVVLYEMLTGEIPFKGEYEQAVLYSILNENPRPVQDVRRDIPANMASVVMTLLDKDKTRRIQQASQVLSDLKKPAGVPAGRGPSYRKWLLIAGSAAMALLLLFAGGMLFKGKYEKRAADRKMLAVLPFENLGSEEDDYLVNGITDAVTARMVQLQGLGVISRQSTIQFKRSTKPVDEIGRELGVQYLLQGTIQREKPSDPGSRIRVIPQLVSVAEDIQMWTRTYDAEMDGIFTVQSEIAERVAEALDIRLLKADREKARRRSTNNLKAYEVYLRGMDMLNRGWAEEDLRRAGEFFTQAAALDTSFALAYAMLSRVHGYMYREYFDRTPGRLENARRAAEKALALDKILAEAYLSLGYTDYLEGRLEQALKEYEMVRLGQPSNADVYSAMAFVYRIQGRLDRAIPMLERAAELDPYNYMTVYELAITQLFDHRYAEAESAFERVIAQVPEWFVGYLFKSILYMSWNGDSLKARNTLHQAAETIGMENLVRQLVYVGSAAVFNYLDEPFLDALDRLALTAGGSDSSSFYLAKSVLYSRRGSPDLEKAYCDSARIVMERLIASGSDDAYYRAQLAVACAKLGKREEALREIERALDMMPVSENVWTGTDFLWMSVEVRLALGEFKEAIDEMEKALEYPGIMSKAWIRVERIYAPLRAYTRFQRLIRE